MTSAVEWGTTAHATRHRTPATLAANGKVLYRSRDLAAAVIHLETALPDNVRRLRGA